MKVPTFLPPTVALIALCTTLSLAATSQKTYETNIARRERNLDHWDAETLAAYLGLNPETGEVLPDAENRYVGIDASVMFYAQWCKNCHKFAPVWDTIGTLVEAGTTQSNMVMALFNCELNAQHTKLCDATGVTHYPTLMFIGAGPFVDSDPVSSFVLGGKEKSAGPYGPTKLKRTVKFQGNLNLGDSVLDWIRTMQGLSKWHQWGHDDGGWLKTIRSLFMNPFDKKKKAKNSQKNALPVGVPPGMNGLSGGSATSKSAYVLEKELKEANSKLETMKKELDDNKHATTHAGYLIDSFLFPKMKNVTEDGSDTSGKTEPLDVFSLVNEVNGWDATINVTKSEEISVEKHASAIVKACVIDMTLDYCTRVSKRLTNQYLEDIASLSQENYPSFAEMEQQLRGIVKDKEPYCGIFDECYSGSFKDDKCRPSDCPFKNDAGCMYLNSCLSDSILDEYKQVVANKVISKNEGATTKVKA